jgi:beta-lactam-binding protein with PASTA domain
VELVVLGACQTGRRGEGNIWSGVAAALMKAGIPAAVAMQYGIWDDAAIAFNRSFYRVLAAGLPLDYAVSAGRLAAFNRCHPVREDRELGRCWRDWGVPVLYLRSDQDFVLPAIEDADRREAVTRKAKAEAERREREMAADQPPAPPAEEVVAPGLVEKGIPAPALTGKSFSEAEDLGRKAGVAVRAAARRYHSSAPVNAVIEQSPEAGTPVNAGAVIEVVLSKGPEIAPVVVPEVRGKTLEQAEAAVEALGLSLKIGARRYDGAAPAETVIQQRARPGEPVKPGSTVSVVLSKGPEIAPVVVPDVTGKTLEQAEAERREREMAAYQKGIPAPALKGKTWKQAAAAVGALGLNLEIDGRRYGAAAPAETVIQQRPWPGETIKPGATVSVVVSRGPKAARARPIIKRRLVFSALAAAAGTAVVLAILALAGVFSPGNKVPDVIDYPEYVAVADLHEEGFLVNVEPAASKEVAEGYVIETYPAAGTNVKRGSDITLYISIGPPPDDAGAYNTRGNALGAWGKYKAAVASYDRAIEIDPAYAMAHYGRSDALCRLGKYEEALKSCDKAIEFDPAYALAHNNRGYALAGLGEYEEAIKSYDKTIRINPKCAKAYYNKGVALEKLGRTDEALGCFKKAHELDPGS